MATATLNAKTHALYRFYDEAGELLYIGITVDPGRRFERHRTDKPWWQDVARVEIKTHSSRGAVLAAERAAIAKESPRYNVRLNSAEASPSIPPESGDGFDGLVGRHFHSWRDPRADEDTSFATIRAGRILEWQGHIVDRVELGLYLVELYSWWDGTPNGQRLVPATSMATWTFYDDALEMRVSLGCPEQHGADKPCGGEITHVVWNILGPSLVCPHCVDSYSGDIQELVWVNGKPKLP